MGTGGWQLRIYFTVRPRLPMRSIREMSSLYPSAWLRMSEFVCPTSILHVYRIGYSSLIFTFA